MNMRRTIKTRPVEDHIALIEVPASAEAYTKWMHYEYLSCRQAAILEVVKANPGATIGAIAAVLNVNKPSVTRAADKLSKWNLLHRSTDLMDRRLMLLWPGPNKG